ncbi:hypothetical protein HGM15179_014113 [Zosterops borbonicus]|uniref:Uncharacterized protein n=1 Tax=Zosterops borbonicus TaxID=364589 RepID=A0A8K1LGN4_9PASS|nr:hypothetical protein HGM15179_014113 [Zosterops borbonicus]
MALTVVLDSPWIAKPGCVTTPRSPNEFFPKEQGLGETWGIQGVELVYPYSKDFGIFSSCSCGQQDNLEMTLLAHLEK